jgi:hypothetical protein
MVQKINFGLALLAGVVFAQMPVDTNLTPCGDAWYYPSKVLFYSLTDLVGRMGLIFVSIRAMIPIFCVRY